MISTSAKRLVLVPALLWAHALLAAPKGDAAYLLMENATGGDIVLMKAGAPWCETGMNAATATSSVGVSMEGCWAPLGARRLFVEWLTSGGKPMPAVNKVYETREFVSYCADGKPALAARLSGISC